MQVCVLDDLEDAALDSADWSRLTERGVEVTAVHEHLTGDELVEALAGCEVVVVMRERTPVDRALLDRLPDLRLLVTTGPRNAAIDLDACRERGVTVCATSRGTSPVVEHAWALLLGAARGIGAADAGMRRGAWAPALGRELDGAVLGLVGLGRTGTRMAAIAAAFNMDVQAWSPNLTPERAATAGVRAVDRARLFATSDVVSIHLVLGTTTRGVVGDAELSAMRPDSVLVNTSRGPLVDEAALLRAVERGTPARIALDVFDVEPLPADHPLRGHDHVLLTPHVGYVTRETFAGWFADVVEDVLAWLDGAPVRVLAAPDDGGAQAPT